MDATDFNDIEALKRRIAELEAAQRTLSTGGGAVVGDRVEVSQGQFIGRDFIQIINHIAGNGAAVPQAQRVVAAYLKVLADDLAGLKLGAIDISVDPSRQTPLQLADVYVPLDTTTLIPTESSVAQWLTQLRGKPELESRGGSRPVSALEALAAHRELTLIGKPGSGKSTFGASVLLALAQAWQGHGSELARLGETWQYGALFPIRVVLRRFAQQLPNGEEPARAGDLWSFVAHELSQGSYGLAADAGQCLQRMAQQHGALILLDGLDECGDGPRRTRVLAAVSELVNNAGESSRFVLTMRPYAWTGKVDPVRGVYHLADLNDAQVAEFIRAWYVAVVKHGWCPSLEAERRADDLQQAQQRADLQPLACNPLLLTLMATLHTGRGRLPEDRADLYNESVDLLLSHWNRHIGADRALLERLERPSLKLSDLREVLEELAFKVHEQNVEEGIADIGEDKLVRAFEALLKSKDKAKLAVDYIEERAGLLAGQGERDGERQFTFPHRTFQEFLAARHLAARGDFEVQCLRLARTAPLHWQVVLTLAARLAGPWRGCSAADELIGGGEVRNHPGPLPADWRCAVLAGQQLLEIGVGAIQKSARTQTIARRVSDWLVAALPVHPQQGGLPAARRAQAGRVLAQLGDSRFDARRWYLPADDMLGFVRIPADPQFMIGVRSASVLELRKLRIYDEREVNDAPTPTPEFYIGRYPVTVAQYGGFVSATGCRRCDRRTFRDLPSQPVRFVSWRDALAYCLWLHEQLATAAIFDRHPLAMLVRERGWTISLPSELEWEVAARGGQRDQTFSWLGRSDPDRANCDQSAIHDTSVVGCFPTNDVGLHDMLGNVWEWTRSRHGRYPYSDQCETLEPKDRTTMVLRGGAFNSFPRVACCGSRNKDHPGNGYYYIGFRVVLRGPPVSDSANPSARF